MWMRASSQATSLPFIQIFSVGVMGIGVRSPVVGAAQRPWQWCRSSVGESEPSGDGVADLGGGGVEVGGGGARLAYALGGVGLAEEIEHHGRGEDGGDGVGLVL